MKRFSYLDTIISPNVTEKSTSLSEFNKVVFKVHDGASKNAIKKKDRTILFNGIEKNELICCGLSGGKLFAEGFTLVSYEHCEVCIIL